MRYAILINVNPETREVEHVIIREMEQTGHWTGVAKAFNKGEGQRIVDALNGELGYRLRPTQTEA